MSLLQDADALYPELKALKDDIHRHPELSFQERRTTAVLREKLSELGLEFVDLGMETGLVAVLQGALPGRAVALRADIDAIEEQEPPRANYPVSETAGVMHACGHDFHTACLYGAARLLSARQSQLQGSVFFLFQPAEEITQGAAAMVAHGLWSRLPARPDCLFALHTRPELPRGEIAVLPGPIMAGKSHFEITLTGVTGHSGSPHKCVDVIVAAAAVINGIQTIVSRNTDPLDPVICAVFSIHAGTPENFVPERLTMTGDIRAHSKAVHQQTEQRLAELVEHTAAVYHCRSEIRFIPEVPVTSNGPELTAMARRAAADIVGAEHIVCPRPNLGSEDFAVFSQDVPTFFYWLGTGYPDRKNACWHSPQFETDDSALPLGAALLARSALVVGQG